MSQFSYMPRCQTVRPHLIYLSPPITSVPTYYVCPHLLCLSPPITSVPTYYVCPHQLCLSSPNMSVPIYYVCPNVYRHIDVEEPGGWVVGWSNLILDPTLALIRAQLGFRIQVGAKCGKNKPKLGHSLS